MFKVIIQCPVYVPLYIKQEKLMLFCFSFYRKLPKVLLCD